jgi:hypothetical protein
MGRDFVQRCVLEHLWYHAGDGDEAWMSIADLARVVYATDTPIDVERVATRRAVRELEAEGLIETLVGLADDPRTELRRRPLRLVRGHNQVLHAAATAPARRLLSRSPRGDKRAAVSGHTQRVGEFCAYRVADDRRNFAGPDQRTGSPHASTAPRTPATTDRAVGAEPHGSSPPSQAPLSFPEAHSANEPRHESSVDSPRRPTTPSLVGWLPLSTRTDCPE